jgi:hypothetical protein
MKIPMERGESGTPIDPELIMENTAKLKALFPDAFPADIGIAAKIVAREFPDGGTEEALRQAYEARISPAVQEGIGAKEMYMTADGGVTIAEKGAVDPAAVNQDIERPHADG